jgi:hypothetical protein
MLYSLWPLFLNFSVQYAIRKFQENSVGLILNGTHQLLVYDENVNLLVYGINTINNNTETLIDAGKEVGLEVNRRKSKYCIVPRMQVIIMI